MENESFVSLPCVRPRDSSKANTRRIGQRRREGSDYLGSRACRVMANFVAKSLPAIPSEFWMHHVKPNQPPKLWRILGMIHALVRDNALLPTTSINGPLGCELLKRDPAKGCQWAEIQSPIISRDEDAFHKSYAHHGEWCLKGLSRHFSPGEAHVSDILT